MCRDRRAERAARQPTRPPDENAVVVVLHPDAEQRGEVLSQGAGHDRRLVDGIRDQQAAAAQAPGCAREAGVALLNAGMLGDLVVRRPGCR